MYHTIYGREDILQVNKYLLKDRLIQNPGKDLRFRKVIIAFNYLNFRKYDRALNMCRDAMMEEFEY